MKKNKYLGTIVNVWWEIIAYKRIKEHYYYTLKNTVNGRVVDNIGSNTLRKIINKELQVSSVISNRMKKEGKGVTQQF